MQDRGARPLGTRHSRLGARSFLRPPRHGIIGGMSSSKSDPVWLIKATAYVWPLSAADTGPLVDIIPGSIEPGLWADPGPWDDDNVSHGEWAA